MMFRPNDKEDQWEPATTKEALPLYLVMAFAGLCMGVGFFTIVEKVISWL